MGKKKSEINESDLLEAYDLLWNQFKEDREAVMAQYKDLSKIVMGQPAQYAASGDTLAKFAELLTKQTSQILELLKILNKNKKEDESLTDDDYEAISKAITHKNEQ